GFVHDDANPRPRFIVFHVASNPAGPMRRSTGSDPPSKLGSRHGEPSVTTVSSPAGTIASRPLPARVRSNAKGMELPAASESEAAMCTPLSRNGGSPVPGSHGSLRAPSESGDAARIAFASETPSATEARSQRASFAVGAAN